MSDVQTTDEPLIPQSEVSRIMGDRVLRERAKWTAEVERWKAHARKHEARNKANHRRLMRIDDILAEMDDE